MATLPDTFELPCVEPSLQRWLDGSSRRRPAIVTSSESISYGQLLSGVTRFGRYLQPRTGSVENARIALLLDPTVVSIAAFWGTLLASGNHSIGLFNAYMALPKLKRLLRLFNPHVLCAPAGAVDRIREIETAIPLLEAERAQPFSGNDVSSIDVDPAVWDRNLVLFTSGSEGAPKGVRHSLRTLFPALRNQAEAMGMRSGQKQLLSTSPTHVIGLLGVLRTPFLQAALCIGNAKDLSDTVRLVQRESVDHVHTVPTWLRAFLREWDRDHAGPLPFRSVLLSGEPVYQSDYSRAAKSLSPECRFIVGLGATEVPTFCFQNYAGLHSEGSDVVPVGRPAADRKIRLSDTSGITVPPGESGNVVVSGVDLWLGYWDQSGATPRQPLTEFHTADIGRLDEQGLLHLQGRADDLLKVSGFRVTPADLEAALRTHPGIEDVCCVSNRSAHSPRLLAAYTASAGAVLDADRLREFLAERVDPWLLPEALVRLDRMPRTGGGKPDRKQVEALLLDALSARAGDAPGWETYPAVRAIWRALLPDAEGLPDENFYQFGGDSLLATEMSFAIEKELGLRLPLTLLLQYPRLRELTSFLDRLVRRASADVAGPDIAPAEGSAAVSESRAPLTPGQRSIWFDHQRVGGGALYHLIEDYEIRGALDIDALQRALNTLSKRHEALRRSFGVADAQPFQTAAGEALIPLLRVDPSNTDGSIESIRAYFEKFGRAPFDLETPPLARAAILSVAPDHHYFALVFHHLIIDGNAFATLYRELELAYDEALAGPAAKFLPDSGNAFDYLEYVRRAALQASQTRDRALDFWREHLKPAQDERNDDSRNWIGGGDAGDYRGEDIWFRLPASLTPLLDAAARALQTTRFVVLLASWQTIWMRLTGQTDAVVGAPFSGRIDSALRDPIGFFVNTLPIRAQLSNDMRFDALVTNLKHTVTTIFDLQSYPGANLTADLGLGAQPLFRQLFALQPDRRGLRLSGARCQRFGVGTATAKVDLAFLIFPDGEELEVLVEYRRAAVTAAQVSTLLNAWQVLLQRALEMPATPLGELPLLTSPMRDQLLQWSGTEKARLGFEECLPDLVERWVRETPSKVAARDTTGRTITYGELWEVSSRVAGSLQRRGIGLGSRVGVEVERSADTPALLLGILRTGAAYVTLEGGAFSDTAILDLLIAPRAKDRAAVAPQDLLRAQEQTPRPISLSPAGAACLFFTSGTTGLPKGAVIPHRAIVRLVKSPKFARFDASTIQLQLAPPAFDASTLELWGPLANGGTVVFAPARPLSPTETVRLMEAERINTLWLTAGLFHVFADIEEPWLAGVRTLMAGGDVISPLKARKVLRRFPHLRLINGYGPTENTTFTCCHPVSLADLDGASIPLGTPICGTEVWVLGSNGQLLPPGCIGEICVGGDGLFLGYAADRENPPAWSVAHPEGRGILYRTGDYGYWNETGSLMFCGRRDRQVKIRGFRVELDALERQLGALPGISQIAVQVDRSEPLHPVIVAHYVKRSAAPTTESDLLRAARTVLPGWQVPTRWVNHSTLPLTPQGKIDRTQLQSSPVHAPNEQANGAFENSVERTIAEIWQGVVGNSPFTAETDFFAAGGDSLRALRATLEIEARFGVPIPLSLLFQASTPRALAERLSRRETIREFHHLVPLRVTAGSEGIPLFFIHGWRGSLFHLVPMIRLLPPHIPVYGVQGDPETAHGRDFEQVVTGYVREIRKFRPHGPWFIAGYSLGGLIAHETARQLTRNGEAARLFLLDSFPHNLPPLRYWAMKILSEGTRGVKLFAPVIKNPIKTLRQPGTAGRLARTSLIGLRRLTGDNSIAPTPFDRSMERLVPRPFKSRAVLFLAMKSLRPLQFGWRYLVRGPVDIERLPVSHGSMIGNDRGLLAEALASHYDRYCRSFIAAATTLRD